jgi:hypothetical protein
LARKKKNQNNQAPKPRKVKDYTAQYVRKAKRSLKSAGVKGFLTYLEIRPQIKGHREIRPLLEAVS